jgi:hypothetical protein
MNEAYALQKSVRGVCYQIASRKSAPECTTGKYIPSNVADERQTIAQHDPS